uniref:Uncharacterized protein n=1 Tax=Oryza rufipogon TaxID=4529 RepID=A0A0E0RAY0_ORYRU
MGLSWPGNVGLLPPPSSLGSQQCASAGEAAAAAAAATDGRRCGGDDLQDRHTLWLVADVGNGLFQEPWLTKEEASPWWWQRENGEGIPIQFRGSFSLEMPLLWSALEGFLPEAASPATFRRAAWLALVWRMEQRRSVHSAVSRVAGADSFWAGEPSRYKAFTVSLKYSTLTMRGTALHRLDVCSHISSSAARLRLLLVSFICNLHASSGLGLVTRLRLLFLSLICDLHVSTEGSVDVVARLRLLFLSFIYNLHTSSRSLDIAARLRLPFLSFICNLHVSSRLSVDVVARLRLVFSCFICNLHICFSSLLQHLLRWLILHACFTSFNSVLGIFHHRIIFDIVATLRFFCCRLRLRLDVGISRRIVLISPQAALLDAAVPEQSPDEGDELPSVLEANLVCLSVPAGRNVHEQISPYTRQDLPPLLIVWNCFKQLPSQYRAFLYDGPVQFFQFSSFGPELIITENIFSNEVRLRSAAAAAEKNFQVKQRPSEILKQSRGAQRWDVSGKLAAAQASEIH